METEKGRARVRAGGRSEKVRQSVGEATLGYLAEGHLTFSIVDVAARAGVGRRTVYRWWPTRHDLPVGPADPWAAGAGRRSLRLVG